MDAVRGEKDAMTGSLLAEEFLRLFLQPESGPLTVSDSRVGLAIIQLAAGKDVTAIALDEGNLPSPAAAQRLMSERMLIATASHYSVLGVTTKATAEEIRENYRRLIALVHPDSRPSGFPPDSAIQVNLAYNILADAEARSRYDASLAANPGGERRHDRSTSDVTYARQARPRADDGNRLGGLLAALTSRRSLILAAALLCVPIAVLMVSRRDPPPPTKLVEARPRLKLDENVSAAGGSRLATAQPSTDRAAAQPTLADATRELALAASRELSVASERRTEQTGVAPDPTAGLAAAGSVRTPSDPDPPTIARSSNASTPMTPTLLPVIADAAAHPADGRKERVVGTAELLAQLADAIESGASDRLAALFAETLPGRARVVADFDQVFRATRKRELRYVAIDRQRSGQRETFSGVAEISLVATDGTQSNQRLFVSGAVARRGDRMILTEWASHPVQ